MGFDYLSARCPWPTNAAGKPDVSPESLLVLHTRVEDIPDSVLEDIAEILLCSSAEQLGEDVLTEAELAAVPDAALLRGRGLADLRSRVHAAIDQIPDLDQARAVNFDHDGVRYWANSGGMSWGDSPTEEFDTLCLLNLAQITVAPTTGEPCFLDAPAIAAALSVMDELSCRVMAALRVSGYDPDQLSIADEALAEARLDVVEAGRKIRRILTAPHR
jgi:hypothetical protein